MVIGSSEPLKLYVVDVKDGDFGDAKGADIFTCAEFDESGDYLAAGDKSGHIYNPVYNMFCAFTSHEAEFDYLKSLEIEEKINAICWLPTVNNSLHLLSTNDKVIKLWRMSEQSPFAYNFNFRADEKEGECSGEIEMLSEGCEANASVKPDSCAINNSCLKKAASCTSLRIPRYRKRKNLTIEVRPRRIYANAHTYHINAISPNSDQETFISADDLRINLWHLDVPDQSFTIVDIKPENMEELNEVITCSRFHSELCYMFGYSTSRGVVRLCDMRARALCDNHVLVLDDPSLSQNRGFFCDIISSLSDFRFDHSGNYILARDYLNLKVWDMRKGERPCEVYSVHEPLRSQLCMLYESDAIFDKFLCSWSEDDRYVFTGSYGNVLRIFDRHQGTDWAYDLGESNVRLTVATNTTAFPLSVPPTLNLRSHRSRLQPKRFISPDSEVASRFQLQAVCLANASALDALVTVTSPSSSSSVTTTSNKSEHNVLASPVVAGSKRRKQTLLPVPRPYDDEEEEDDEEDDDGEDVDEDSDEFETVGGEDLVDGIRRDPSKVNGRSSSASVAARSMLMGLREIDYKRRFLQVACHPQRLLFVAMSGKEMFFVAGKETSSAAGTPRCPENEEIGLEKCRENVDGSVNSSHPPVSSPLDIKAAKRRRRRKGETEVQMMSSLTDLPSGSPPAGQTDDTAVLATATAALIEKRRSVLEDVDEGGKVTEDKPRAKRHAADFTADMEFE
ncbi:Serine/threonine-protein phosphatase 2A regulatory subunit B alpha isoform [Echinococcus granulosus]|uniref:Serine/threonine-protein phosphatase 2A 55 kDa regulatory subunit B n=1 Tax=Echinococcus granulosus TaxID=6210 RepID=W6UIF0_ECHGR|nr:Serine/threonine-protein phosphatase 2A regulatory subunit B alpha isoform [Echinococcus granulosus]EUB60876.1 Serine/threonine-protein phosphatase 2A regulatory subunit B alpha isoform [Echinococcus granulosus]